MKLLQSLRAYLANLPSGRAVLWCYLCWYLTIVFHYFDPTPRIWITSLGISGVIGFALILSVASTAKSPKADRWQVARLFIMPFCVSSFSSLVKDRGFILVFSPRLGENATALAACLGFLLVAWAARKTAGIPQTAPYTIRSPGL